MTKMPIRLHGCADWFSPFLCAESGFLRTRPKDLDESVPMSTVNVLKFQTLAAGQKGLETVQTQIRLLLKKQSDQGLPCLLFWEAFCYSQP